MTNSSERIESPCIRRCCLNENDICLGCFRTLAEIVGWADSSNEIKQKVLEKAETRRLGHEEKYQAAYGKLYN